MLLIDIDDQVTNDYSVVLLLGCISCLLLLLLFHLGLSDWLLLLLRLALHLLTRLFRGKWFSGCVWFDLNLLSHNVELYLKL